MRYKLKSILFFLLLLASFGCTSIIRFSDKSTEYKEEAKQKQEPSKKKSFPSENKSSDSPAQYNYKNNTQKMLLEEAQSWIGTPYKYGGTDKKGVDCSGLTYNVYLSIGTILPRTAEQQFTYTKRVSVSELEIGDLIFFVNKGKITHVGIYASNNSMIHSSTSNGVISQSLESYTSQTIAGCGRP